MRSVYDRLDANASAHTQIIESQESFQKAVNELKTSKQDISLAIGGGGAYGEASYRIALKLLSEGIHPTEYVGNSAGAIIATLLALGYEDPQYVEHFLSGLDKNIKFKDIPLALITKLIPFVYEFPEEYKLLQTRLFQENDAFFGHIKSKSLSEFFINGELSTHAIEKVICDFFGMTKQDISLHKITFNDVKRGGFGRKKTGEGVGLRILAGAITDIDTAIKRGVRRHTKENNGIMRAIQFRGTYPVFDAIFASACPGFPKKTNIKGGTFRVTDGYMAGQNFPSYSQYFTEKNTRVLIHTDDDFFLTKLVLPDYGDMDYVFRPDMRGGDAFGTSPEARTRVQDATMKIIGA
ncbi:MAG: patatin-like phospholipase family protein [Candidatus Gracilibacteria bacterium]|nr:patatin-like phospholipase family protein [Candidatus Gracilibacteria bacterium]